MRERWVGWAAAACAVHCLLAPALALWLPLLALGERIEALALAALIVAAAWLLWRGHRRHGRWLPAAPVVVGMTCWLAALAGAVPEGIAHAGLVGLGGVLTFTGLQWSARSQPRCGCVACEAAGESGGADITPAPSA